MINTNRLFKAVKLLIEQAQQQVVRNVNTVMLLTYFQIGRMIVEDEQKGTRRAGYAKEIIKNLSRDLTKEFSRGYSVTNLEYFRSFYLSFEHRIPQTLSGISRTSKGNKSKNTKRLPNSSPISQTVSGISPSPFSLSWSHYVQLLKIEDINERNFYEIEAAQNNWSVRELTRQFNAALYERVALSKDKKQLKTLAEKGQLIEKPTDALKSHYVLEFLDLKEDSSYSESELETAIINRLEHFMLELGKGFLFAGRQRRFTFEGDSFSVDLVFYNRLLRCFVLLDLKIGKLTHQDIGQMQMYINYYDRRVKLKNESPTIGIILCKEENKTVVEFTLPENNKTIFAKEYKAMLPSKDALKKQLK